MRFLSKEKKRLLAYLGSKALELSFIEQTIPSVVPFLRLGLSNSIVLSSLNLEFPLFILLCLLKSAVISTMSGTLLSPFFAVSLCQSVASGVVMYVFARLALNSVFGLSLLGASVSAVVQLALCSLYMDQNLMALTGPMLLFSIISASVTAAISVRLRKEFDENEWRDSMMCAENGQEKEPSSAVEQRQPYGRRQKIITASLASAVLLFSAVIFFIRNVWLLLALLFLSLVMQIVSGRRLRVLPHVFMWIFVIGAPYLVSDNVVLLENLRRAMRLSAAMCLSQCATKLRFPPDSLIGMTFSNFNTRPKKIK